MYVPPNKIIPNQYTTGGEFVFSSDIDVFYKGYYYSMGSKYYTNSTPTSSSVEIIRFVSKQIPITSSPSSKLQKIRYIARNLIQPGIIYKFIDEKTYERLKNIKSYQVISTETDNINDFQGLKQFLDAN